MNHYGQIALDHNRAHRPTAFAQIPNPTEFFETAGEEIQAQVTNCRDEILGPPQPGEDLEAYRHRSYQALATAEELVLSEHWLLQPEDPTESEDPEDDPILDRYYRNLAEINRTLNAA